MNKTIVSERSYPKKYGVTSNEMEKYNVSSNYVNVTATFVHNNYTTSTTVPMSYGETNPTTTVTFSDEDTSVCETGHCKQIASKMLSYMNHSADPCDDFYEYACGGFEANSQLTDEDLVRKSRNYERIAGKLL